jgi:anti-sigma factor RsiW
MKPFEEQFSAWVDGQLNDAERQEFEKQLATHPEAAADKEAALKLGRLLRAHPTAPRLGNPDFFNHQLMQRIAAETPRPVQREERKRGFFFGLPSLAWAGAFCLVVSFALFKTTIPSGNEAGAKSDYFAQVVESWPTSPNVSASTVYNPEDNVTVLWLDGLDYIPATNALK